MIKTTVNLDEMISILNSEHSDPFNILGMHEVEVEDGKCIAVRVFSPESEEIEVLDLSNKKKSSYEMTKIHSDGFFEVILPEKKDFFSYKLSKKYYDGSIDEVYDPYSFLPVLTDFDLYLFNEGKNHKAYEKIGAHTIEIDGVKGTVFAVWAPSAKRVSIIGNFNSWDGRRHPMRSRGSAGVWELFIPGIEQGEIYKYEIKTQTNDILEKADPYAFYAEYRPCTGSVVYDIDNYEWKDSEWLENRKSIDLLKTPVSIYEVHLGSWVMKQDGDDFVSLTYRELAEKLIPYVKEMGYTHIELLPVMEHPFDGSWGYQVTGYYAPTSRFGTPEDFMYFVDKCHEEEIGIILDWVPAHFPKDGHALGRFDGTALYEHADPKQGEHPDWGTYIFNFGRNEVRSFLVSNAKFWMDKYHIDGLRVDAVASMLYLDYGKNDGEWVPNCFGGRENLDAVSFLKQLNEEVYADFPGVMMIAEESTSWAGVSRPTYVGGLGFGFKWNMGWMNDFLRYIEKDPIHRKYHHNDLTFGLVYAFTENFILVLSHDEVVHGKGSMIEKMPGDYWQKFANLRTAYGFMYGHPGNKLLFMGSEFGQFTEWRESKSLDWHLLEYEKHSQLKDYVRDLNKLYVSEKSLWQHNFDGSGFEWIDLSDNEQSMLTFIRKGDDPKDILVFVCNFTPTPHEGYKVGVPFKTFYKEILNSDSEIYGGSNMGNDGGVYANEEGWNWKEHSITVTVPPLATVVFKPIFE